MKLVEILARELEVWPEWAFELYQDPFGKVEGNSYLADKMESLGKFTVAEDHALSIIGKPEWQAERDRMKAMEEISKFSQEQDQLQHPVSPTYEQQLWDRVAYRAWELGANDCRELDSVIRGCAIVADAFMAERAKRVGK